MKPRNIFNRAFDFGTFRSRDNFLSFLLKFLFYIIPAIILGYYTDIGIKSLENEDKFGDNKLYYILLQTILISFTLYIFVVCFPNYMNEFQKSITGAIFIVIYYGIQTNYFFMLKDYMNSFIFLNRV